MSLLGRATWEISFHKEKYGKLLGSILTAESTTVDRQMSQSPYTYMKHQKSQQIRTLNDEHEEI